MPLESVGSFQKFFGCVFVVISHNNFVNVTKSDALEYVKHVRIVEHTKRLYTTNNELLFVLLLPMFISA